MESVGQVGEKEKFDIGQVHEAMLKLRQAGLTPKGLQRLVLDKKLAREVVTLLEGEREKLEKLEKELKAREDSRESTYSLFNPSCKSVTLEQLQNSNIPNKYLFSLWVSFKSQTNNCYTVVHTNKGDILLSSKDKNRQDFKKVCDSLSRLVGGRPERGITDRFGDICQTIVPLMSPLTSFSFTQRKIASWVQDFYMREFNEILIGPIHFRDVPFKVQVVANLPLKN